MKRKYIVGLGFLTFFLIGCWWGRSKTFNLTSPRISTHESVVSKIPSLVSAHAVEKKLDASAITSGLRDPKDPTYLSQAALDKWETKAAERDPKTWAANLFKLIDDSKGVSRGMQFRLFLGFLSTSQVAHDASGFTECVKLAFNQSELLKTTFCDMGTTTLAQDLSKRLGVMYRQEGRGDEFFFSVADDTPPKQETAFTEAVLTELCDYDRRLDYSATHEIKDKQLRASVQFTLLNRWLVNDRLQGAAAFLDPKWEVPDLQMTSNRIVEENWFRNNANEFSTLLKDSPPSDRRTVLIDKMIPILKKIDPESANAWVEESLKFN